MEKDDKGSTLIRMGVSGWKFLLVPAYPGCPGSKAVKRSLLSGTTWVSRYQKGKTNLDFTEARDSEWQWNLLGHTQVCTSLQTDNHASTPPLSFYRPDALPAAQPTASKHWRHNLYPCNSNFALAPISTLVWPALVAGLKQPLQMNDFITFDMLPYICPKFSENLPTTFWIIMLTTDKHRWNVTLSKLWQK